MFTKVLVALKDASILEGVERFLQQADAIGQRTTVRLVHVIDTAESAYVWPNETYLEDANVSLQATYERLREQFPRLIVESKILKGDAKELLLAEANKWPADVILVGTHLHHDLVQFILGTVSTGVISKSPCPVVVIQSVPILHEEHNTQRYIKI